MSNYTDSYIVIRMWCPPTESENPKARFVRRIKQEDGTDSWTTTDDWKEAHFFEAPRIAGRVLAGVDRLRTRIARGWVYEIVRVTEEVLSSNLEETTETEEVA